MGMAVYAPNIPDRWLAGGEIQNWFKFGKKLV
jgi:hypothetical protein